MGCVIKYKGQSIPEEQFLQYLNKQITINNLFNENETLANAVYESLEFKNESVNVFDNVKKEPYEETFITLPVKDWSKIVYARHNKTHKSDSPRVLSVQKQIENKGYLTKNVDRIWAKIDESGNIVISDGNHRILALNNINPNQNISIPVRYIPGKNEVLGGNINELFNNIQITPQQKQQAQQLYSEYLDTIFPDSKIKDIVYHGTKSKESFEEYKTSEKKFKNGDNRVGFYFTKEKGYAEEFGRVIPNIINTINPIKINEEVNFGEVRKYQGKNDAVIGIDDASEILVGEKIESYVVFEPEQIHILSSKKDIEGFKNFVSKGDLTQGRDNYESRENQLPDIHKCK